VADAITVQERSELISYFVIMRDNAKEMLRFMKLPGEGRKFWQRRFDMCDRAVKLLVEVK
jgi:hypothetical protein